MGAPEVGGVPWASVWVVGSAGKALEGQWDPEEWKWVLEGPGGVAWTGRNEWRDARGAWEAVVVVVVVAAGVVVVVGWVRGEEVVRGGTSMAKVIFIWRVFTFVCSLVSQMCSFADVANVLFCWR